MSLRGRLSVLFGAAGMVVLVIALLAWYSILQVTHARADLFARAEPARLSSAQLLAALADQETGLRGYALTRDEAFLAPYHDGLASEGQIIARLRVLLVHDPASRARLTPLMARVTSWREQYVLPLLAALRGTDPSFDIQSALARSKAPFDAIRAELRSLDASLLRGRDVAARTLDHNTRRLAGLLGASVVLLVAVGLVIVVALRRLVTEPLERVAADVRVVVGGDLQHEIPAAGTVELRRLAADTDEMRRRIVDELGIVSAARGELDARNLELARSNEELEQFAYVASHDLQEPLRKVVSFTQLLQKRYGGQLDDQADEYIAFAVDGARRMQVLINDLLAFSRVGRSDAGFTDVDLSACVRQAELNLSDVIEAAGATIRVGPLPVVRGDQSLLTALFQNLVGNAVKFRADEPPVVLIEAEEADGLWWCSVTDNGIGIEPRFADRVFVIFQRLHGRADYDGTGIGLALSRKVVEHHGGSLWLDTEHHPGARLCFTLPANASVEHA